MKDDFLSDSSFMYLEKEIAMKFSFESMLDEF